MRRIASLAVSFLLSASVAFADSPKNPDAEPAKPAGPAKAKPANKADKAEAPEVARFAADLEELRQTLQSQQAQIEQLREELARRDKQIAEAQQAAAGANARAVEASAKAAEAVSTTAEVKTTAATLNTTVAAIKASNEAMKTAVTTEQAEAKKGEEAGPVSIKFKGITITPGGFLAAETVFRQRSAQADVNTPFTGTPFPNNALSRVTEFNASGRQSRISLLAEGKADNVKLAAYYETDWLSACTNSNNRQSNSYCNRQRQLWGQASLSGLTFTGGQMWSLATETKKGLDNRTEALPMTVDAQYNVGFTWQRQFGFRVTKNFNDKVWLGLSVEGPQTTLTGHGSPTSLFFAAAGASGGLLNAFDSTGYSINKTPDFIVKAAYEPGWGHYEVFGIISTFRARVYPCSPSPTVLALPAFCAGNPAGTAAGAFNDGRTGGGIGANLRVPLVAKKVDAGLHVIGGDGVGRYSSAQLADATTRPDGTLSLIRGGGVLGTLELHPTPKLDIYLNYGAEYAYRSAYTFTNLAGMTVPVGYGSRLFNNSTCESHEGVPTVGTVNAPGTNQTTTPLSCTGDTRNIQEGTIGFWHQAYKGTKGGIRWGIQYSYLLRNSWSGNGGLPAGTPGINAKAIDNMVFTSFRYYVP